MAGWVVSVEPDSLGWADGDDSADADEVPPIAQAEPSEAPKTTTNTTRSSDLIAIPAERDVPSGRRRARLALRLEPPSFPAETPP